MTTVNNRIVGMAALGLFLATLDTGIINVALPTLQTAWHTTAATVAWTVAAYTIALAGTVLFWGRLADHVEPERVFSLGLLGFALASLACGAAPSLAWLITARALQGLSSALLQGTAVALATVRLPPTHRATAVGTLAMFQGRGPVIGPTVGGVLLTMFSWRNLFWMNLPVTVPLFFLVTRHHRGRPRHRVDVPALDIPGNLLLMITVSAGLLALTPHSRLEPLWFVMSLAAGFILVVWERRAVTPLIPRGVWSSGAFWAAAGAILVVGGATALAFMVPPYTLRLLNHLQPWQVGLINMSAPLFLVLVSRPASHLLHRWTADRLMLAGLALMAAAFLGMAELVGQPSAVWIVSLLAIYGLGAAVFFPSNLVRLLSAAGPEAQGVLGAMQRLAINLGTAIDASVVGVFLTLGATRMHPLSVEGVRVSWLFGVGSLMMAMLGVWVVVHRESKSLASDFAEEPSRR